ncbi:hypothetical protein [Enterococcus wangshanyuanii]|uniref:Uncharacterized protein n=1 Tax=Enterococcus wangshanyuanii TaxID=2005703 RepID=A0ABQ1PPE9_9ENTE|nr:hypothetical protein [Enterococcus wangshanyuanii]GGD00619.1 hypothetical protein GCM10011573_32760 [Enterococcus wangshanyuanii]
MKEYLWVYILGAVAALSFLAFLLTLSRDIFLVKRLKLAKINFSLNFTLLLISLTSIILIIYLFALLKDQIRILG